MRNLSRNEQIVYYALFNSMTEKVDDYGNKTGTFSIEYATVQRVGVNVSASRGTSDLEQFGINLNYTKTLVTCNMKCPISETSVLWLGYGLIFDYDATEIPSNGDVRVKDGVIVEYKDGNWVDVPHNYVVVGVAKSLNSITYAVKEVTVG